MYDPTKAEAADVDIKYTIKYTVTFKEYTANGVVMDKIDSTFEFKISCPSTVYMPESLVKTSTSVFNEYDVADPDKMVIKTPVTILKPEICYEVTGHEMFVKDQSWNVPAFLSIPKDMSGFEIDTSDR